MPKNSFCCTFVYPASFYIDIVGACNSLDNLSLHQFTRKKDRVAKERQKELKEIYAESGCLVFLVSAKEQDGIEG